MRHTAADLPQAPDEWLTDVLRREAATHHPDRRRIMARLPPVVGGRRPVRRGLSRTVLAPLSVAAVSLVTAVIAVQVWNESSGISPTLRTRVSDQSPLTAPGGSGTSPGLDSPTLPAAPLIPAAPTPEVTTSTAAADPAPTAGSALPSASDSPGSVTPSASSSVPESTHGLRIATSALPDSLVLPRSATRDWVVVGARQDLKPVRAESGTGVIEGPEVVGDQGASQVAPIDVSWTGGSPEQDRTSNDHWLSVPAAQTALRVRIDVLDAGGKVVLYVGGAAADVVVRAAVGGGQRVTTAVSPAATNGATAAVVTLTWDERSAGQPLDIEIGAARWDGGGVVSLAAVELR